MLKLYISLSGIRIVWTKKRRLLKAVKNASRLDYQKNKEMARHLIVSRLEYFNSFYNFSYGRVSIRDQKTRWGSCSRRGNLNFNYRLLNLSAELRDYVIVHELCHLQELNHGHGFWSLVQRIVPDHKKLRRELKMIRL
jgi:hypothetical protein